MRDLLDRRSSAALLDGTDLRETRRACGIRQETLAAGLGVARVTVSGWEARRNRPPEAYCRVMAALARHLEVTW